MPKYFEMSHGLRGCYMPDDAWVIEAGSLYALKTALQAEADAWAEVGFVGGSKLAVQKFAKMLWELPEPRLSVYPYCLPLGRRSRPINYSHGIFVAPCSEADYARYINEGY